MPTVNIFPKFWYRGPQIWIIRQKCRSGKWRANLFKSLKSKLLGQNDSNTAKNDSKEILLMIHDVNSQHYHKIFLWGSANLGVPLFGATFLTNNPTLEPPIPNFLDNIGTILTVGIMHHQEYFLGIILSHI